MSDGSGTERERSLRWDLTGSRCDGRFPLELAPWKSDRRREEKMGGNQRRVDEKEVALGRHEEKVRAYNLPASID